MEAISSIFRVSIANFFKTFPIPNSFGGFVGLSGEWLTVLLCFPKYRAPDIVFQNITRRPLYVMTHESTQYSRKKAINPMFFLDSGLGLSF